jgi:hypothetical protein
MEETMIDSDNLTTDTLVTVRSSLYFVINELERKMEDLGVHEKMFLEQTVNAADEIDQLIHGRG